MKCLFDTSVLVAAMVETHPMRQQALPWLKKAKQGDIECVICSHTLAELYAVLTRLPLTPRIAPATARHLIQTNLGGIHVATLSQTDYWATIKQMAEYGIAGGNIYDALIAKAAQKTNVDRLITFNVNDFKKVCPDHSSTIMLPF